jgi:hypothetical protein
MRQVIGDNVDVHSPITNISFKLIPNPWLTSKQNTFDRH